MASEQTCTAVPLDRGEERQASGTTVAAPAP